MVLFYVVNELVFKHLLVQYTGIRLRPYLASPGDIFAIGNQLLDSSFPSSHVASSLVILTLFVRRLPKRWIRAAGIAILVGLSRIHNGMHYPTDVLAGAVL
jgi:undecaprenyl-diphosphatase